MRLRAPLAVARGLGSAKSGVHHWRLQRLTAVALVPLTLWFVVALIRVAPLEHAAAAAWVAAPVNATLLGAFVLALFWHAQLGVQVVIEDYVHGPALKIAALVLVRLASALLGLAALVAILRLLSAAS